MQACITNSDNTTKSQQNFPYEHRLQCTHYTNGSYKNRTVNLPGAFGIKEQDQIHVALAGSITWLKIQH